MGRLVNRVKFNPQGNHASGRANLSLHIQNRLRIGFALTEKS